MIIYYITSRSGNELTRFHYLNIDEYDCLGLAFWVFNLVI